jgi:uncharacterized protein
MVELHFGLEFLAVVGVAFVLAGLVKGVVGGGLPAVAVPIMMAGALDPAQAAALTLISVIATNVWLLIQGGLFVRIVRRYWPILFCLAIGSGLGSQILVSTEPATMKTIIGALVVVLSPLPFLPHSWAIPDRHQVWLNPVAGLSLGLVGGATVMLAPVIIYFVALRLEKDLFVAAMGAVALSSMTPLFAGLTASGILGWHEVLMSAIAFIPAALGMVIGVRLRKRISQRAFQVVLSVALLAIGTNLIIST